MAVGCCYASLCITAAHCHQSRNFTNDLCIYVCLFWGSMWEWLSCL